MPAVPVGSSRVRATSGLGEDASKVPPIGDEKGPVVMAGPFVVAGVRTRYRLHHRAELPWDHFHRQGWNDALGSLADIVVNELGEVVSRDEVLRQIRLLLDYPDESEPS
jgi:hypothetical protein